MFDCNANIHLIGHWRVWILTPRWPLASDQKLSCVYNPLSHVAWTLPEVIAMVTQLLNCHCSEQLSDHNIKANQSLQSRPIHAHINWLGRNHFHQTDDVWSKYILVNSKNVWISLFTYFNIKSTNKLIQ